MDPSQQWQHPQQPQQQPPQQPPQYPVQYPVQYPQYPVQYPQQPQPQPQLQPQPQYPSQPYSAQPYNIAPNSGVPYSAPPVHAPMPAGPAGPLGPLGPQASRSRLVPILAIGGALVVILVIAIVVVALHRKPTPTPTAAPGTTAAASQSGPVDTCLVGKWKQSNFQKTVDFAGTDIEKREGIGKVKMVGSGKTWTINADGSAIEDDSKFVYSGKDDKGRTITATFSGTTEWRLKTVGRTIEYAGKESDSALVVTIDGRKAGTITLEPNLDPVNYTCVDDVWRTTPPTEPDTFSRYDRVK